MTAGNAIVLEYVLRNLEKHMSLRTLGSWHPFAGETSEQLARVVVDLRVFAEDSVAGNIAETLLKPFGNFSNNSWTDGPLRVTTEKDFCVALLDARTMFANVDAVVAHTNIGEVLKMHVFVTAATR